jgi:hypothetical protein
MKTTFKISEIRDACLTAFDKLKSNLPPDVAQRLVANQKALRHGTDMRIFEFQIRDKFQPGTWDKKYFSYGVIYDPDCRYHKWKKRIGGPSNLNVRWYANRHRTYDKSGYVIPVLWEECQKAEKKLSNFIAYQNEQVIGLFRFFDGNSQSDLEKEIYNAFLNLMPYWHSRYATAIDLFRQSLPETNIKDYISGRKKYQPSGPRFEKASYENNRIAPEWLRRQVFALYGKRCLNPKCLSHKNVEADHVIPPDQGGLTVIENLQPLCQQCNGKKSNRDTTDYRKAILSE